MRCLPADKGVPQSQAHNYHVSRMDIYHPKEYFKQWDVPPRSPQDGFPQKKMIHGTGSATPSKAAGKACGLRYHNQPLNPKISAWGSTKGRQHSPDVLINEGRWIWEVPWKFFHLFKGSPKGYLQRGPETARNLHHSPAMIDAYV